MSPENELDLNAYIDGELTSSQEAEFLEALRDDPELARRTCEMSHLKAQLRVAYADLPQPVQPVSRTVRDSWQAIAAGVVMLAVGIVGGWIAKDRNLDLLGEAERFVVLDPDGRGQAPAVAEEGEMRIVFHLTNPDQTVAGELLDDVEGMLTAYQANGRPLRVEVVSHSDGLGLLRERLSKHKPRIHELSERFANLTFVACQNSIDRLKIEHGIEVQLLPDAEVIDSGVSHVVERQKQGWSYIRV